MAALLFAPAMERLIVGGVGALPVADLHLVLLQPSYVFQRAHRLVSDLRSHELTVDDYIRQRVEHARITRIDDAIYLDADDVDFGGLGPGERVAGAALAIGSSDDAELHAYFAFERRGTTGGAVRVNWTDGHLIVFQEKA